MNECNIRLIRIKEVMNKTGIARSTIWYMVKKGTFPVPRKISPRVTVWVESEINKFIEQVVNSYKISSNNKSP